MTASQSETVRPIFIRPSKVSSLYGISKSSLYRMRQSGQIQFHKRGHCSFVRCADLERLITGKDAN